MNGTDELEEEQKRLEDQARKARKQGKDTYLASLLLIESQASIELAKATEAQEDHPAVKQLHKRIGEELQEAQTIPQEPPIERDTT